MITEQMLASTVSLFLCGGSLCVAADLFRMTFKAPKTEMDIPVRFFFSPMIFLFGLFFLGVFIQGTFGVEVFDPEFFATSVFGRVSK